MVVSLSKSDSRRCVACGAPVRTQLWLVLHRHERPMLWGRCLDGSIHRAVCDQGHQGFIRAPLLLYDPILRLAIYSPAPSLDDTRAKADGAFLVEHLRSRVSAAERDTTLRQIQVIPREMLGDALRLTQFNLSEFAPGLEPNEHTLSLYDELAHADLDELRRRCDGLPGTPAWIAALNVELGMRLNRLDSSSQESVEEVIRRFHMALNFYTRATFPRRWATIHAELGLSLQHRLKDLPANLREAIRCYDAALDVLDADSYPEDYAITQSNRANALADASEADETKFEFAIEAYRDALGIYNPQTYLRDWALVHANLATAFMQRNRSGDVEDALESLDLALTVYSRDKTPRQWALAKMHRGTNLRRLPHVTEEIRREAIQESRDAYEILRLEPTRERLSATYNLGLALAGSDVVSELAESANLLEEARTGLLQGRSAQLNDCTQQLADVYTAWADRAAHLLSDICARALRTLEDEQESERVGLMFHALSERVLRSYGPANAELAVRAAKRALDIFRYKSQTYARAATLGLLGNTYLYRGERPRGWRCFDASIQLLQRLEQTPETLSAIGELQMWLTMAAEPEFDVRKMRGRNKPGQAEERATPTA